MKKIIKEALPFVAAILLTGGVVHALPPTTNLDNYSQTVAQEQAPEISKTETPAEPEKIAEAQPVATPEPTVAPETPKTWQDNPQNCNQETQYIASEAPFGCIDKPQGTVVTATNTIPTASGSHTDWMAAAGISTQEYAAVDYILSHESGWNHTVWNSGGSGAYGLCQALPASKMSSAGPDWETNPITQLKWCNGYAKARYGGWWGAYNFWVANKWW